MQSNSPVTRAVPCTSENWNIPAAISQTCLWVPLFHLLSGFRADLSGQASEMAPTHHYLFVGEDSVKDIAVGIKSCSHEMQICWQSDEVLLQKILRNSCCTNSPLKGMLMVVSLFHQCFLYSCVKRKSFFYSALIYNIQHIFSRETGLTSLNTFLNTYS